MPHRTPVPYRKFEKVTVKQSWSYIPDSLFTIQVTLSNFSSKIRDNNLQRWIFFFFWKLDNVLKTRGTYYGVIHTFFGVKLIHYFHSFTCRDQVETCLTCVVSNMAPEHMAAVSSEMPLKKEGLLQCYRETECTRLMESWCVCMQLYLQNHVRCTYGWLGDFRSSLWLYVCVIFLLQSDLRV